MSSCLKAFSHQHNLKTMESWPQSNSWAAAGFCSPPSFFELLEFQTLQSLPWRYYHLMSNVVSKTYPILSCIFRRDFRILRTSSSLGLLLRQDKGVGPLDDQLYGIFLSVVNECMEAPTSSPEITEPREHMLSGDGKCSGCINEMLFLESPMSLFALNLLYNEMAAA